jgi:hypothetical protein
MGIDTSQPKSAWAPYFSADDRGKNPWMTGLYGYQNGVATFGLMENGTMFLGRQDRGGRIIFDGNNGTIYGGINGIQSGALTFDQPMWNMMRLNLVDLDGAGA